MAFACETSWPEDKLLVWLPLGRAEQYYHALLRRANWRTYARDEMAAGAQIESLNEQLAAAPPPWMLPSPDLDAAWARFDAQT